MKGLILDIFVAADGHNCSNHGISARFNKVVVVGLGPDSEIFEPTEQMPAIKLVFRDVAGERIVHAEPLEPGDYMDGGAFVSSSDSRFGQFLRNHGHTGYVGVHLHDRREW